MEKIRFRNTALMLAIVFALTACANSGEIADNKNAGDKVEVSEDSGALEAAEEESPDAKENGDDSGAETEKESEDGDDASENDVEQSYETVALKDEYSSDFVCIADLGGNVLGRYTLVDIANIVKKTYSSLIPETFLLEKDGILYYSCVERDGEQNNISHVIMAIDPGTGEVSKVVEYAYEYYLDTFDFYKGALHMAILEGEYGKQRYYRVLTATRDEGKLNYSVSEDNTLRALYDLLSVYDLHINRNENRMECYERIIDDLGFIIREKDKVYYRITANGSVTEIRGLPDNMSYVSAYDSHYMFFPCYDDNYNIEGIYAYSAMEERARRLNINPEYDYFVSYTGGKLYYCDRAEEEYGINTAELRYMDVGKGTNGTVLNRTKIPGTRMLEPLEDVIIKGDKVFFRDFDDGKVSWFMADTDGTEKSVRNLGIVTETIDTFDYGNVSYLSATANCPFCGIPLEMVYAEIFVLDPGLSENAGKINEALKNMMDERTAVVSKELENLTDAECSEHKLYPRQYCVTDEYTVDKIKIIDDRYLTVEISGYWYGGGAHGYPSREQHLFDLTTGEELTIKDFFHGSEDDFKKIIATKVKEDFENYDEESDGYRPYFVDSADEVYESAYGYVNFEDLLFDDDGILYYFYPYNLASYADGFIEVTVSYEELLGRKTLGE